MATPTGWSKILYAIHYLKQLIVGIGKIGTRATQDIWLMRRQACTQLDAYMARIRPMAPAIF